MPIVSQYDIFSLGNKHLAPAYTKSVSVKLKAEELCSQILCLRHPVDEVYEHIALIMCSVYFRLRTFFDV